MKFKKLVGFSLLSGLILLNGCGNNSSLDKKETKQEVSSTNTSVVLNKETKKELNNTTILLKQKQNEQNSSVVSNKEDKKEKRADPLKGQKIYSKRLKKVCGMNGGEFARKHTQKEWIQIQKSGKLVEEITSVCKGAKIKNKYLLDLGAFFIEFANDSGNVPSGC